MKALIKHPYAIPRFKVGRILGYTILPIFFLIMLQFTDLPRATEGINEYANKIKLFFISTSVFFKYAFVISTTLYVSLVLSKTLLLLTRLRKIKMLPGLNSISVSLNLIQIIVFHFLVAMILYSFVNPIIFDLTNKNLNLFSHALLPLVILSFIVECLNLILKRESESSLHPLEYFNLIAMGLLSGIFNSLIIFFITNILLSNQSNYFALICFGSVFVAYIYLRKKIESQLVKIAHNTSFEVRNKIIQKILASKYYYFEKTKKETIHTTLNNDAEVIGTSANTAIVIFTNIVSVLFIFAYLSTISFVATMIILITIILISLIYYGVNQIARNHWENARDSQNVFIRLVDGLIYGIKDIILHSNKKMEYQKDIYSACQRYKNEKIGASLKFVNTYIVGESLILIVLGLIISILPLYFSEFTGKNLISFVVIFLYLTGPIGTVLYNIPEITQIRISWRRIRKLISDLNNINQHCAIVTLEKHDTTAEIVGVKKIDRLDVNNLCFKYENDESPFGIGPINFNLHAGEALFITGGNGSGKTTLLKTILGLYPIITGEVKINGSAVTDGSLGEYFSGVFSDFHLFHKLYAGPSNDDEAADILKKLELDHKVSMSDNRYSTLGLSRGESKRLALFQCLLSDRSVYFFDEWAADQDPRFKKIFYHQIIPMIKKKGKIILVITHDDNYFHTADKIIKLVQGKIHYKEEASNEAF
ncbi:MAG: cyclic peptide export ABC transporter [Oligoflexia bacterium]|nr:cyclic peptide export ABC transporter [Oligoflexia bacterium]